MKTRDFKGDVVTRKFISVLVASLIFAAVGYVVFVAVQAAKQRGTSELSATVRLADGATEDEIAIVPAKVTKRVAARAVVFNRTSYSLQNLTLDTQQITFDGCMLAGTYATRECVSERGISYWVTLTTIE